MFEASQDLPDTSFHLFPLIIFSVGTTQLSVYQTDELFSFLGRKRIVPSRIDLCRFSQLAAHVCK